MSEGTCLTPPHRGRVRKPHYCFWCNQFLPGNSECTISSWVGDGTVDTIYECDRCSEYVAEARERLDIPAWEPMYAEQFWDYMEGDHPRVWWQWCVDDALFWQRRVKYGCYASEQDRENDMRRATVALERAQKQLAKVVTA